MDILDIRTTFFRRIAVHLERGGAEATFFRPIPVQIAVGLEAIPPDTRSFPMGTAVVCDILFPAHTRSRTTTTVAEGRGLFPSHPRSFRMQADAAPAVLFRPIPVHLAVVFHYLCTGMHTSITSTTMAGTVKDMSLIKQVNQQRNGQRLHADHQGQRMEDGRPAGR